MVRNKGKLYVFGERKNTKGTVEGDIDALFRLPLAEFVGARNALAARLKKSGRGDNAALVKALAKPPISAWAVNQLYWNHREAFDRMIASAERFHKAQASRVGGKMADMRTALDARREALTELSDLATSLLRDAGPNPGQNPSLDVIRRITSTLEAMSAMSDWASPYSAPRPGRLTDDVDPPGFETLASFVPGPTKQEAGGRRQVAGTPWSDIPKPARSTPKSDNEAASAKQKQEKHQLEEARKSKIAASKVSLQDAKRSLTKARARAQSLEAAQKKADAETKKAEKHRRDVEASLEKAKAASEDAARRARNVVVEIEEASSAVDDAERTVEKASKELELLVREA